MRFELRLFVIAALIFVLVALACHSQAIAEVRRGLDGPGSIAPARKDFELCPRLRALWRIVETI